MKKDNNTEGWRITELAYYLEKHNSYQRDKLKLINYNIAGIRHILDNRIDMPNIREKEEMLEQIKELQEQLKDAEESRDNWRNAARSYRDDIMPNMILKQKANNIVLYRFNTMCRHYSDYIHRSIINDVLGSIIKEISDSVFPDNSNG